MTKGIECNQVNETFLERAKSLPCSKKEVLATRSTSLGYPTTLCLSSLRSVPISPFSKKIKYM
jgi:hypothetical protein